MPLHPDVEAFLELVTLGREAGLHQPMHELEVAQARSEFEASAGVLDPDPPRDTAVVRTVIPTRDGNGIEARLYRAPQCPGAGCPVILYFHGGGFVVGSLDSHDSVCRRLSAATGHAVLAPAYRLAPEHRFPTATHDSVDAALWLSANAQALGLDATHMVVAGDSAGATLATVLAQLAAVGEEGLSVQPVAQLLFYPVTDVSRKRDSHQRYGQGFLLETATLDWFYQHYLDNVAQRQDARVSPLLRTVPADLAPAYVNIAEFDPLADEGLAYAEALKASGVQVTLKVEQGATHDFLRMTGISSQSTQVYAAVAQWLEEQSAPERR